MAIHELLQIGHPALKYKNKTIIDFHAKAIHQVVTDLIDSMHANDIVGIAAPQIGENYQIFVTEPRATTARAKVAVDELRVYINPQIVDYSKETCLIYEGCGSVLKGSLFGPVIRPQTIIVEAYNLAGQQFRLRCNGLLSRVIQHEYDHLQGIEFTEKITDYRKLMAREFYLQDIKDSQEQTKNSIITIKEVSTVQSALQTH